MGCDDRHMGGVRLQRTHRRGERQQQLCFCHEHVRTSGGAYSDERYDARFARAIGKWALNAANAARLFYPNYLPANYQDSYAWAHQYDTNSYIAHEALRQFNGDTSPYGTGDAVSGGWGATTLTLYGSSHAGILGGIIDTTDVPMILQLDLLKTDYYGSPADPSYLYYNPYDNAKTVTIDAGSGMHDIYDAAAHQYIANGVSGASQISIPANSAILAVIVPSGETTTDNLDETLVNGIVIDFHSGRTIANYPPRIKMLAADQPTLLRGDTANVYCTAVDRDTADTIAYTGEVRAEPSPAPAQEFAGLLRIRLKLTRFFASFAIFTVHRIAQA